ncbi:ubiquitin carboxyl-terminal hydrolase 15 [Trichonephila clavipes]|nr:ubiquitin carboxyl-terminal hydrolase 15 [Trichonephila clavipes]
MSIASVTVVYTPTVWPHDGQKTDKRKPVMDREWLDENSTEIWTKTMIQRYDDRPTEKRKRQGVDDNEVFIEDEENDIEDVNVHSVANRKRDLCSVIRYRSYETDDIVNYKREMVMLYVPFSCEAVNIQWWPKLGTLIKIGMDCFDCIDSTPNTSTDLNSVLISIADNLKSESLSQDIMCNDEIINDKNMATDFTTLGNLEILNTCQDNVFNSSNTMMECFSDINNSPDPFDIPSIDNDDSVLPVYGPFAELDSQSYNETDTLDVNAVPGVCGLKNLGNTCFMNAGLQCLLNNKIFKSYFAETDMDSFVKGTLSDKFAEIMKKIWSGSYSSLHLSEFKECFGDMYVQFRNYRQV